MKKVMVVLGALSLGVSAPAQAGWIDGGLWSGSAGCSNKIPSKNRWFHLLGC